MSWSEKLKEKFWVLSSELARRDQRGVLSLDIELGPELTANR